VLFEKVCFVSVSGGKDSTLTLALALEKYRGTDVPVIAVFADTHWEHPLTYKYLDQLEEFFGIRIQRLSGYNGGLPELIKKKRIFPSPRRRFCTQILKSKIFRKLYLWTYLHFPFKVAEVWQGIRREESRSRRNVSDLVLKAGEKRFGERYPFDVHFIYPIKNLRERQVFEELKKRGIPINPLYEQGFKRVGCYPCFISKKDIVQVILKALEGDRFAVQRLKEMKELDCLIASKFYINHTLNELIEQAKARKEKADRIKKYLLPLPFPK